MERFGKDWIGKDWIGKDWIAKDWPTQEQLDAANMVLQKPRLEWNRLDCSDAERLTEETDEIS